MAKFVQIFDLEQEHSDDMAVIHVSAEKSEGQFNVRTHYPNLQRYHDDFDAALADVQDRASRSPYLSKLAILLDEGAVWEDRWGSFE